MIAQLEEKATELANQRSETHQSMDTNITTADPHVETEEIPHRPSYTGHGDGIDNVAFRNGSKHKTNGRVVESETWQGTICLFNWTLLLCLYVNYWCDCFYRIQSIYYYYYSLRVLVS